MEERIEQLLEKLCELSRLSLTSEEKLSFRESFKRVIEFVDKVKSLNLPATAVPPLVTKESMELAEDQPEEFPLAQILHREYRLRSILEEDGR